MDIQVALGITASIASVAGVLIGVIWKLMTKRIDKMEKTLEDFRTENTKAHGQIYNEMKDRYTLKEQSRYENETLKENLKELKELLNKVLLKLS